MNVSRDVLERRGEEFWVVERLYPDVEQAFLVKSVLYQGAAQGEIPQEILIVDTVRLGKALFIDGALQTSEEDEFYYHEMVHVAINAHWAFEAPLRVLIIGGGDGGFLREVEKYSKEDIAEITLVEIDKRVVNLVRGYMPSIPGGAFADDRVRVVYQDGAVFAKDARVRGDKFDIIIVDSPDPIGPAKSLFATPFYLDLKEILAPEGVLMRQTGSAVYQPDEWTTHVYQMQEIFPEVRAIWTVVPTYVGGPFTFVLASNSRGLFDATSRGLNVLCERIQGSTRWYNKDAHEQVFNLPPELRRQLDQKEYGRVLIMDLYKCDYETLIDSEAIKSFVKELTDYIGMKAYGEPIIPDFGHGQYRTAGLSVVQLIETSDITAHLSPHWRIACEDVFTCSSLDPKKAVEFSMHALGAEAAKWRVVPRGQRLMGFEDAEYVYKTIKGGSGGYRTIKAVYTKTEEVVE